MKKCNEETKRKGIDIDSYNYLQLIFELKTARKTTSSQSCIFYTSRTQSHVSILGNTKTGKSFSTLQNKN